ncbi:hypothetical protein [Halomonas sp. KRD171]|uniref:hypothetical protein n=1 Tax=Halomonas sp. KRD171 TaxID=2729726 RepID=UPI0019D0EF32|nr:hypothetical protein [Halomonas sp. KRD171]
MRDLVARGKPPAHPRKQREAVPGVGYVPLGVVPTPFAGAHERSLNSLSRYHALRVVLPQCSVHARFSSAW